MKKKMTLPVPPPRIIIPISGEDAEMKVDAKFIEGLRNLAEKQKKTANLETFINALGVEKPSVEDFVYTTDELDDCDIEITEE